MQESLTTLFGRHVAWTSDHPIGLVVEHARGPHIFVSGGRRIIDLISGIAVSSLGHGHPRVLEAAIEQIRRHTHVMVYGEFIQKPQVALATLLAEHLPENLQTVYFTNSGTEANEGALKLAKKYTRRSKMIAFEGSFHGDTQGSLSVTGRRVYREPFQPLLPHVQFLPFNDTAALEAIDRDTACVITEPIQGEGGLNVPTRAWMAALRTRCTATGTLLIFDEVQTGSGRTGSLYAFEQFGVVPDILTVAKAFGGGFPLGGFVSSPDIFKALRRDPPLSHVTTFGGHPVSCAAAHAAMLELIEKSLPERALQIEDQIRSRLRHEHVEEIRGRGAMLGLLMRDRATTAEVVRRCLDAGVLLGWTLHSDRLIRIAPPLNIDWEVLTEACDAILAAADEVPVVSSSSDAP